jgi:hypothetical protein
MTADLDDPAIIASVPVPRQAPGSAADRRNQPPVQGLPLRPRALALPRAHRRGDRVHRLPGDLYPRHGPARPQAHGKADPAMTAITVAICPNVACNQHDGLISMLGATNPATRRSAPSPSRPTSPGGGDRGRGIRHHPAAPTARIWPVASTGAGCDRCLSVAADSRPRYWPVPSRICIAETLLQP